jgi:hypothetical protein
MAKYQVKNQSGQVVSIYDADSKKSEALWYMAREAGYESYEDYKKRCPRSDKAWWLTVNKLPDGNANE